LFPWLPGFLEKSLARTDLPYAVDYDDAVFHQYDRHRLGLVRHLLGGKIDRVMAGAALVTAGNDYLAQRARDAGASRIEIVPTVIDLARYPVRDREPNQELVVGWIGSPSTQAALVKIAPALARFCAESGATVRAIGARPGFALPGVPLAVVPWTEEDEVAQIGRFDIGIMPLSDDAWSRGKCGLKLIQYMGCGLPVVASPVGANREIVDHGITGWLANEWTEWLEAFRSLAQSRNRRDQMGLAGRERVERRYSLAATLPRLDQLLTSIRRSSVELEA